MIKNEKTRKIAIFHFWKIFAPLEAEMMKHEKQMIKKDKKMLNK